ncbi:transmembrane protein [Cystoisospora suis]|uniref:Transmembrane protein n=1 Tax=Cystoisospora suis TaxID=483139 RepID=A0A2C6L3H9_9APIC|nr:transmembrane protein [Cystoisospora suis]
MEGMEDGVETLTLSFDEAAVAACSAASYNKYIEQMQNQLNNASGSLENLVDQIMSGWDTQSFDYAVLGDLIDGKISILDYLKKLKFFLLVIVAALLLVVTWFVFCLPKVFCRYWRRCCCCIRERKHDIGFTGRLVVVALGGTAVTLVFIFGVMTAATEAKGVAGIRSLQCHLYTTIGEMIKGSDPNIVATERFIGVRPLFKDIRELSAKLDTSSEESIVADFRAQIEEDFNFEPNLDASRGALTSLEKALKNAEVKQMFHKCAGCDMMADNKPLGMMVKAFQKILGTNLDISSQIAEMFEQFTFPTIVLDQIIPVTEMDGLVKNATDTLAQTQPSISGGLVSAEVMFGIACSFVLLLMVLGALWLIMFFFRSKRTGTKLVCLQWNVLCLCAFLLFLVAGVVGLVMDFLMRGCQYTSDELIGKDNWTWILDKVDPDGSTIITKLADGCLTSEGSGDLVDILGYKEEFDDMVTSVEKAVNDAVNKLPTPPKIEIPGNSLSLDQFTQTVRGVGWAVLLDEHADKLEKERLNTFPEFLSSGVQEDDVNLNLPGKGVTKLHGLRSLELLVKPWKFSALRPGEPADEFTITDAYPQDSDPFLKQWLDGYKGKSDLRLNTDQQKTFIKNAIWWSVQKHRILNATYACPRFDSSSGTVTDNTCSGREFFAYTPLDWSKSYIVSRGDEVVGSLNALVKRLTNSIPTASEVIARASPRKVFRLTAIYSFVAGGGTLLWVAILLIVWRKLKDNKTLKYKFSDD